MDRDVHGTSHALLLDMQLDIADYETRDRLLHAARTRGVRFGTRKVYLASLGIDLGGSTPRVLRALHRDGLIVLSRADLVAAMDPDLVRSSRVEIDGDAVHFLVVD
ncbi:MAG: hypothetical protein ACTHU0_14475 [Kofleriaceae bacterium]